MGDQRSRRRFLAQCCAALAAPVLAGCGLWDSPAPQAPVATRTPAPTPTVTTKPAPVRIEPPPTVTASAIATATAPRVASTPGATPSAAPPVRASGQLLYAGTLDGRRGIILADLAANARKLLVPGRYEVLTWSPDGARFAALGVPTPEAPVHQVAIFAADGRPLARYPIAIDLALPRALQWSPSGRQLLYRVSDGSGTATSAWLVDDSGQRQLVLDANTFAWGWLPSGRLGLYSLTSLTAPPTNATPLTFWSSDPGGGDRREEVTGAFYPVGLSPDGTVFYGLGGLAGTTQPGAARAGMLTIVACDLIRNTRRTLVDASVAPAGEAGWIGGVSVAPQSGLLAVVRARIPVAAQQNTVGATSAVEILDAVGQLLASDLPWQDAIGNVSLSWSPNGLRLGYHAQGVGGGGSELRVVDLPGGSRATFRVRAADPRLGLLAAWSADDHWLAYVDVAQTGLLLADPVTGRTYPLAADGNFPAWRPRT